MGRTPNKHTPNTGNDIPEDVAKKKGQAAQELTLIQANNDEVLAAGMDLGRLEALTFVTTIGNAAALNIYENVKKSKAWRFLRNPNYSDGRNFESLDEYCRAMLGKSYNRLQDLTQNRSTVGQEAFEQAQKIGLRQVDFEAIKALPAPDQELIAQALREESSKDEVLNTLQALAAKHAKEKETLSAKLEDSQAEATTALELAGKRNEEIVKLKTQLKRIQTQEPDAVLAELAKEANSLVMDALGLLRGNVRQSLQALADHYTTHGGEPLLVAMAGMVGQLQAELTLLRTQFDLPDVSDAEKQRLAAEMAEWDK